MGEDITIACGDGIVNMRVGAIIIKDDKILMTGAEGIDYFYSVGGRIKHGETAGEAVEREVFEETGVRLKAERLAIVHENYFYGDTNKTKDKLVYEVAFFYVMEVPDDFEPVCNSFNSDGSGEFLQWIELDSGVKRYPDFYNDKLPQLLSEKSVIHLVTDERKRDA